MSAVEEDWRHLEDPKGRRKIQNRVAQRIFRRKRKALREAQKRAESQTPSKPPVTDSAYFNTTPTPETAFDGPYEGSPSSNQSPHWSDGPWTSGLMFPITPPPTGPPSFDANGPETDPFAVYIESPSLYGDQFADCLPIQPPLHLSPHVASGAFEHVAQGGMGEMSLSSENGATMMLHFSSAESSRSMDSDANSDRPTRPSRKSRTPSGGLTALQSAAAAGHEVIVKLLLDEGAFVDATTFGGATALHLVAASGLDNVAKLLIDRGASVSACDGHGKAPLHLAAQSNHSAVMLTLLTHGADVNAPDVAGSSALHLAAHEGLLSIIQLLLESGADINAKDGCGRTALHCAAEQGHSLAARLLLDRGIDIHATTEDLYFRLPTP